MQTTALRGSGLNPAAYSLQILKRNGTTGAFGLQHDGLRYAVVRVSLESPLFTGQFFQFAFCCFSSSLLKTAFLFGYFLPHPFDIVAGIIFSIAVSCDVNYSKINTEDLRRLNHIRIVKITYYSDVPNSSHKHKVNFAFPVLE